jgi:hypothetical protein
MTYLKQTIVAAFTLALLISNVQESQAQLFNQEESAAAIIQRWHENRSQAESRELTNAKDVWGYNPYYGLTTLEFRPFTVAEANYHRTRGDLARIYRARSISPSQSERIPSTQALQQEQQANMKKMFEQMQRAAERQNVLRNRKQK